MNIKSQQSSNTSRLGKFILATTISSAIVFAGAKAIWNFPKPLLIVSGVIFFIWLAIFFFVNLKKQKSLVGQTLLFLVLATGTTFSFFKGAYYWDRAGWNWYKLTGYNDTWVEERFDQIEVPVADFVRQQPFFEIDSEDASALLLRKGAYDIDETIVVPQASLLKIEPGVVLRFGAGRSLIAYCPVIARGTESEPIIFRAQNRLRKWGAFGVVSSGKSIFEHVKVEDGRHARINDIELFGALSFIESDVNISHCEFFNLYGKDGLHVNRGRVMIRQNMFRNCFKDGVDLDGGAGEISQNEFINCEDEGIDLSENVDLRVFDNVIKDTKGGRIGADHDLARIKSQNTLEYLNAN